MVQPLHLIKWEHIPLSHQNGYSVLTLSVPGNWPGASIPRMAIALTSVLLDRMASTHIWHGREQPYHHDRMAQPLYLTYSSEWLWISALISDMEGTNPLTMTEWLSPYIWPWKEPILSPCQNGYGSHHFLWEEASIWRTPSLSLKYSNFSLANGFVNTSAIYSSVATYMSFTAPLCTISLI